MTHNPLKTPADPARHDPRQLAYAAHRRAWAAEADAVDHTSPEGLALWAEIEALARAHQPAPESPLPATSLVFEQPVHPVAVGVPSVETIETSGFIQER